MGDALQERVARMASGQQRFASGSEQLVHQRLRREWYVIDERPVFFHPALSIEEIRAEFEFYRKSRIEVT